MKLLSFLAIVLVAILAIELAALGSALAQGQPCQCTSGWFTGEEGIVIHGAMERAPSLPPLRLSGGFIEYRNIMMEQCPPGTWRDLLASMGKLKMDTILIKRMAVYDPNDTKMIYNFYNKTQSTQRRY